MQFQFNNHRSLSGLHAPFSPSQPSWLRYDDEKALHTYVKKQAAKRGTRLHAWAKETIDLGIKQPKSKKTLYAYINDAIGFQMETEVVLFYSERFFGTADAIKFKNNYLRVHDLKTGETPADMEQLFVYVALFCLEYRIKPSDLEGIECRLYQNDDIWIEHPTAEDIVPIMDTIVHLDKLLEKFEEEA
jgi:hypothetical protein